MDQIGILLLIQIVLIALNAVFACAEIAVLSVNETKMERLAEQGSKKAQKLLHLTEEPAKFLSTIQVAITLSGFLGSALAADNFSEPLVDWLVSAGVGIPRQTLDTMAVVLITLILSYFTLIFGELVPKRIAMKKSEELALAISGLISAISALFKPVVWVLSISTNLVLRLVGIDPNEEDESVSEEDIIMMVDASSEKGAIDFEEKEFIQNVFEFDDLTAGEIATHRTDITALWLEDDDEVWAKTIHESRYTLYPVCEDSPDHIIGILNAKDYFRLSDRSREAVLAGAVKPPYFVPETIKADVLFRNMKKNRYALSVVMDEYGGVVGIVTLNDLIEELVGEISDDDTPHILVDPQIRQNGEDRWSVTGNIPLSDVAEATGIDLASEEYDTLTGLVFDRLGQIPEDGVHSIELTVDRLAIRITTILDHRIESAEITRIPDEEGDQTPSSD